jgi:YfiH family protein
MMIQSELLGDGESGIRHGFFTRQGGVSEGIYTSLNCGLGSADAREAVAENRARVARRLGGDPARLLSVHQVHSPLALIVDAPWPAAAPKADALVTRTPGLAVGVLAADCAPVLFADPEARVVGAAHAGWRGALSGVIEATLDAMESLGARRDRIGAAVGPCISQEAYEVGKEFQATFLQADPANAVFFGQGADEDHVQFDLPGYCLQRLRSAGIAKSESLAVCTYSNESNFFSYRRSTHRGEPDYGRQISAMLIL